MTPSEDRKLLRGYTRRAMSLPELVLSLALASGIAMALGHIVLQMTHSITAQEHRSQNQSEGALTLLRLRSELREARSVNALSTRHISFSHPDVNGDGLPDVVTYDWDGTAGSQITRDINGTGAATVLSECVDFSLLGMMVTPATEELLAGHVAYLPPITATRQEFTATYTGHIAEVFAVPARSGNPQFRVTRVRLHLRPITATGSVMVSLRAVSSGNPSSTTPEYVTRPISQLSNAGGWEDFRFGANSGLTVASSYCLVVRCATSGGSVGVAYDQITANAPGSSTDYYKYSNNSGNSWQPASSSPAYDLKYLIYGRYANASGNDQAMVATSIGGLQVHIATGNSGVPVQFDGTVQCVNTPEQVQ